jgi:hypothetical protein
MDHSYPLRHILSQPTLQFNDLPPRVQKRENPADRNVLEASHAFTPRAGQRAEVGYAAQLVGKHLHVI